MAGVISVRTGMRQARGRTRRRHALLASLLLAITAGVGRAQLAGDVNCDGARDADDLQALIAVIPGDAQSPCAAADTNGDGAVGAADIVALLRILNPPTPTPVPSGPSITFFGLASADGTAATALGNIDGASVYFRNAGSGFQIVVEGAAGLSGALPGVVTFDRAANDPTRRPDLQIESNTPLGDGSLAVCEGGVPAVNPPDFGPTQAVADVLNDLACHFVVATSPGFACTQDGFGIARFLAAGTRVQFCGAVAKAFEFPAGETVLSARLRDTAGNLGPAQQIVLRVGAGPLPPTFTANPTATTTRTVTPTPTATTRPSATPTPTRTPTSTRSPTRTATAHATSTLTRSPSPTSTPTPRHDATSTATASRSTTPSPAATSTPSKTAVTPAMPSTSTVTVSPSTTPTTTGTRPPTATRTATSSPSATTSPKNTSTPGLTATPTLTRQATATATRSLTPTVTATLGRSSTPTQTGTATSTPTRTPTPSRTSSPTRTPTATTTPTPQPTKTRTPSPSQTPTATRSATPTRTATATRTWTRTATPTRTATATPAVPIGPVITFFGVIRADDTQLTPTPGVPPIYTRPSGHGFSLVIEGGLGLSKAAVGSSAFQSDVMSFPDLQIEVSNSLGNGSGAVCDRSGPSPGGVPAVNPASFASTQTNINAVNDLACRFLDGTGAPVGRRGSDACVMFDSGDFGFVNKQMSTIQFCGFIDQLIEFPPGDTLVTARLRDVDGNPGSPAQLMIHVGP
jgi:hypothetical protein